MVVVVVVVGKGEGGGLGVSGLFALTAQRGVIGDGEARASAVGGVGVGGGSGACWRTSLSVSGETPALRQACPRQTPGKRERTRCARRLLARAIAPPAEKSGLCCCSCPRSFRPAKRSP